MKALSLVLIFSGYTLIYAAVARQGAFATEPWAALFADAYADLPISGGTPQQNAANIATDVGLRGRTSALTPQPPIPLRPRGF